MLSSDWLTKGKGDSDGWVNHVRTPIILLLYLQDFKPNMLGVIFVPSL